MRFEKGYRSVPRQLRGLGMVRIRPVALKEPMRRSRVRIKLRRPARRGQTLLRFLHVGDGFVDVRLCQMKLKSCAAWRVIKLAGGIEQHDGRQRDSRLAG